MKTTGKTSLATLDRRAFLTKAIGAAGASAAACLNLDAADALPKPDDKGARFLKELEENERLARSKDAKPMIGVGDKLKIMVAQELVVSVAGEGENPGDGGAQAVALAPNCAA